MQFVATKKQQKLKHRVLVLLPLSLFLSNFSFFSFAGQKIRPLESIVPFAVIIFALMLKKIKVNPMMLLMLFLPFGALPHIIDLSGFFSSYVFWVLEVLVLYIMLENTNRISDELREKIIFFVLDFYIVCTGFGIVQFFLANIAGNRVLYNCFGQIQYHKHYDNELRGLVRATSIFYEPSVYGWMSVFVFAINEYLPSFKRKKMVRLCCVISLVISFSSTGILGALLILSLFLVLKARRRNGLFPLFIMIIAIVMLLLTNVDFESFLRLNTIKTSGSSGYNRVTYPIDAATQVIANYPLFGRGLGQIGVYDPEISNYGQIFNSIFGIIVLFGASGLIIYQQILSRLIKWFSVDHESIVFIALVAYLLFSNGSFLTLEFPVISIICQMTIEYKHPKSLK